jgi:hypothetical protein
MTASKLNMLTDQELLDQLEACTKMHGHNVLYGEVRDANRSYWKLDAVRGEFRARGPWSRADLARLFNHPEMAVRYYTAMGLFALDPIRARAIIEEVKDTGPMRLAGDAGMTLRMLDDGTFKPS